MMWPRLPQLTLSLLTCSLVVAETPAISVNQDAVKLVERGAALHLSAKGAGEFTWTSSDPSIASVYNGWVFGRKAGKTTLTVAGKPGQAPAQVTVDVEPGTPLAPAPSLPEKNLGFITRTGNQLLENGKPFRFISWNIPNLHIIEDPSWRQLQQNPKGKTPEFWHATNAFEQEDALRTVSELGGRVVRIYTLSILGGKNNAKGPNHYEGPAKPLNEALMKDYDRMLALANRYGIRLIAPIIDEWDWFGGRKEFAALNGGGDFYTDRRVIDAFKALIDQLVNRVNTITGVAYKDDPAIMAWETGNELQRTPQAWTTEIAAFLKQKAPKQLVSDGADWTRGSLDDPNIDMVTSHYYENGGADYASRLMADATQAAAKKPFFAGEFGCTRKETLLATLDATLASGATGALWWSLRFRASEGGFYWHDDGVTKAYHWPGFASNATSSEREVMQETRLRAWGIRGFQPPARLQPGAPVLLAFSTPQAIAWQGSTGAETYTLERSIDGKAWQVIADKLEDAGNPFVPFADATAKAGNRYQYRIRAVNEAGTSDWSPVLTLKQ